MAAQRLIMGLSMVVTLAGCGSTAPPRERLLPEFDPDGITTPARANQALKYTQANRERLERIWARREYDCYQVWLVNRCREKLGNERRTDESRLKTIEVRSHQVLREDEALTLNRAQAQVLADRQAEGVEAENRRREALDATQRRERDAADNTARRAADDARRRQEAGTRAQAAAARQQDARDRQAEAERKRQQAPANAQAYRQRQRDHVKRQQDHDEHEAQRAAKAADEQARKTDPAKVSPGRPGDATAPAPR